MRVDRSLRTFFVDNDADDLHVVGRIDLFQHFIGIGHLRDGIGRDERDGVDVLESGLDESPQIGNFDVSRNPPFEPLPGIPRTLDQLEGVQNVLLDGMIACRPGVFAGNSQTGSRYFLSLDGSRK